MDNQLEFVIKAVDEASAAIAQVKASTDSMKSSVDANTMALKGQSDASAKSKSSNDDLSSSVFKGIASWDLLKQAAQAGISFLEDSAKAFVDAQQKIDLAKSTVIAMGGSLQSTYPQIQAFGDAMGVLGVDNEAASLSAAQLAKAAGGDVAEGLKLAKLAADLTSSGYNDLTTNTNNLIAVINGRGTVAMRDYKIAISDTASTSQILDAIQGKVTQTTEQYAQTIPGKLGTVSNAYDQLKQAIGGGLVDALDAAVKSQGGFSAGVDTMNEAQQTGKIAAFEFGEALLLIVQGMETIGNGVAVPIAGLEALSKALSGDFKGATAEAASSIDILKSSESAMLDTVKNMLDPLSKITDEEKAQAASFNNTSAAASDAGFNVGDMSKKSQLSIETLAQKTVDLASAFSDMSEKSRTDLATMADDNASKMKSIQDQINKTQQSITDLTRSYNQTQVGDTASVAEAIVASQNKVADIKKQMAAATTQDNYDNLAIQLKAEQKNLDSSAGFIATHEGAIATAKARAQETDLQRTIDDYTQKRTLADQQYQDQLNNLNSQLAAQQSEQSQEIALYQSRTASINKIIIAANADYVQFSNDRLSQTTTEVAAEIQLFQQLQAAISSTKSASSSAVSTISVPTLPHRAEGGPVIAGSPYLVGELGMEIFTPSQSGYITPNNKIDGSGSGGGITINITGTFMSENAAMDMANKVVDVLKRRTRIGV